MTKLNLSCLIVYLFAVCCLFQQLQADDNSTLKERLINEAIPAWRHLEKKSENLTFTISETRDDVKKTIGRSYAGNTSKLSIIGSNLLECVYYENEDGTVMENISCRNKRYCFAIGKAKREDAWRIHDLYLQSSTNYDEMTFSSYQLISTAFAILNIPMRDIVTDPAFEIRSFSSTKNTDGDELITLTFTLVNNKLPLEIFNNLQTGVVTFNATKNWIILSYNLSSYNKTHKYSYQGIGECEYDFSRGTPYLKTQKYTLVREQASQPKITWISEVQKIEPCTMKDKNFTLSAFGLPEPKELNSPFYFHLIRCALILSGLIMILIGLYMKFFAKKMKAD
ncbi:MAG: hypothetical protein LBJ67_02590 [Planctomycetaceae bacterium]|jgi:hypothetical protein|nr:hypothetical protein [Planctomycetaceae bacterium]